MKMNSKTEFQQQDKISDLERMVSSAKLQFKAENKRCDELQQQVSLLINDKLNLEKKLTELQCKYEATKQEVDEITKENQSFSVKNYDLEIALAEGDVYDQVVKENMEKLENLCATLREQRDEQNTYHKQKEISLKNNFERKLNKLKQEKAELTKNLTDKKMETVNLKDELEHYREAENEWKKEKERMFEDIENLSVRVRVLEKDLYMEKETVNMLSLKNNNLSASLMEVDKNQRISTPISNGTVSMIEELVNKFYEKKMRAASSFNDHLVNELKKQLAECESALTEEKQARSLLTSQLETTEEELLRAKSSADSLFELSVARTKSNLNRCNNLKLSPRPTNELPLKHLNPLVPLQKPNFPNFDFVSHPENRTLGKKLSFEGSENDENVATAADSIFTNVTTNESLISD